METEHALAGATPVAEELVSEVSAFLSYDRPSRNFVASLASDLQDKRILVRGDWQIAAGEDWGERVADLIRRSDIFIFLLTPASVRSSSCLQELNLALSWQKKILPVIREQPAADILVGLPDVLAKKHWVFARSEDDLSDAIASIVTAVQTDFELTAAHTRLTVSADAWEKRTGDLLRGTYLDGAQSLLKEMDRRKPLPPSASPKMRLFVDESQKAERRRERRSAIVVLVTIVIVGLVASIIWQRMRLANAERNAANKRAVTEALHRDGDSALAAARGGDIPGSVGVLENVVGQDVAKEFPAYRTAYRFLRPLLMSASQVISAVHRPSVFRWRGRSFALLGDGKYVSLPGAAVERFAFIGGGKYLITIDVARTVCIFRVPELSRIQCVPIEGVRVRGIYEQPQTGALVIVAGEQTAYYAYDEPPAEGMKSDEGEPFMVLLRRPDGKPETIPSNRFSAMGMACKSQTDDPCGFRRVTPLTEGANVESLSFPQLRQENEYWIMADRSVVPQHWNISAADESALAERRVSQLNFAHTRYAESGAQLGDYISNGILSPAFFVLNGSEFLAATFVLGQNVKAVSACHIASQKNVDECWSTELAPMAAAVFSPDHQYVATVSPVAQDSFHILQLPRMERCAGFSSPQERAVAAAFAADGKRLSVVSREGELWMYAVESGCQITLQRKVYNSQLVKWIAGVDLERVSPLAISFVNGESLVITHENKDVMGIDATNGLTKWIRSGPALSGAGPVSVTASHDQTLLALWNPTEIQLIQSETGILLSSPVGPGPRPLARAGIARVTWTGDSIIAEWDAQVLGRKSRILLKRLSPQEAESHFLAGVPTTSLIDLPLN